MYFSYVCAASRCICLSGCLGPSVGQDAPSFGNSLSRCSILCRVTLSSLYVYVCVSGHLSPCVCQDASSFGNSLYAGRFEYKVVQGLRPSKYCSISVDCHMTQVDKLVIGNFVHADSFTGYSC